MIRLKGHTEMVTCLAESTSDPYVVASGSEDCSVRLWDVRTNRSVRRLECPASVSSIVNGSNPQEWLVGSGNSLIAFDLRREDRVILKEYETILEVGDEINEVDIYIEAPIRKADGITRTVDDLGTRLHSMSMTERVSEYSLAVVDDNGVVTIKSVAAEKPLVLRTLSAHSSCLAQTCRFLTDDLIVSGGFDNNIVFTSVRKQQVVGRLPMVSYHTFNPPHVHCVDIMKGFTPKLIVAAALGDGSVIVIDLSKGGLRKNGGINFDKVRNASTRLSDVHRAAANCVRFIDAERVATSGNDSALAIMRIHEDRDKLVLSKMRTVELPQKPNSICFPTSLKGQVLVADIESDVKVLAYDK